MKMSLIGCKGLMADNDERIHSQSMYILEVVLTSLHLAASCYYDTRI